jgi:ATP-dependent Zn protease
MYGPPGTGKTLLARACAAQTDATFLKLAGPQLVQMFIGDGAKLVRDCFALAKEKAPSIIFIDELDAVGTKRFDSDKSGDREVQRTMLELLNQLDGFASDDRIKVLAATNRVDVLDPALLRSGRLDRKIEFPLPNEESRAQILRIHSRKMTVDEGVNWPELARSTDEFGGAMLKAVCVEAGMIALRLGQNKIIHEHYVDAISEVQSKKKESYVMLVSDFKPTLANSISESQSMPKRLDFYCIGGVGGASSERHTSGFVIIASARHDSSWTHLIQSPAAVWKVVILTPAVLRFDAFATTLKLALLSRDLHLRSTIA